MAGFSILKAWHEETVAQVYTQSLENSSKTNSTSTDSSEDTKDEDSKNFEILAREIYNFIRQRLEIERERSRNYY